MILEERRQDKKNEGANPFLSAWIALTRQSGWNGDVEHLCRTLGTAVFAGMLGVTLFGIFLTPVFCYVVQWLSGQTNPRGEPGRHLTPVTERSPF